MSESKVLQKAFFLSLVSHNSVTWTLIKISAAYKYVGLLV